MTLIQWQPGRNRAAKKKISVNISNIRREARRCYALMILDQKTLKLNTCACMVLLKAADLDWLKHDIDMKKYQCIMGVLVIPPIDES